ncbi:MAG: hypothetical protein JSS66_04115 [Armatimonadetes bacterium]|nr:hypothetical protein [Armatimonadota bacterium]
MKTVTVAMFLPFLFALGCGDSNTPNIATGPPKTGPGIMTVTPGPNIEGYASIETGDKWKLGGPKVKIPEGEIGVGRWLEGPSGEGLNVNVRVVDARTKERADAETASKSKPEMSFLKRQVKGGDMYSWKVPGPDGYTRLVMQRPAKVNTIYATAYFPKPPTKEQEAEVMRVVESIEAR